jgi:acyl-CoA dehydrogenase
MSDLLTDQFDRILQDAPQDDAGAWSAIEASGFLDLLVSEEDGGAGSPLDDAYGIGLALGRRLTPGPVLETMLARSAPSADAERTKVLGAAAAAAVMAGAMDAVLDMTLEYASVRKQFGREISKFQAVQHQLAVMAQEVAAAKMAARLAFQGQVDDLTPERAAVAKVRTGEAAQQVMAISHAVHGAIGISEEFALQRYTKRLRALRLSHGGESAWAEVLGRSALRTEGGFLDVARTL